MNPWLWVAPWLLCGTALLAEAYDARYRYQIMNQRHHGPQSTTGRCGIVSHVKSVQLVLKEGKVKRRTETVASYSRCVHKCCRRRSCTGFILHNSSPMRTKCTYLHCAAEDCTYEPSGDRGHSLIFVRPPIPRLVAEEGELGMVDQNDVEADYSLDPIDADDGLDMWGEDEEAYVPKRRPHKTPASTATTPSAKPATTTEARPGTTAAGTTEAPQSTAETTVRASSSPSTVSRRTESTEASSTPTGTPSSAPESTSTGLEKTTLPSAGSSSLGVRVHQDSTSAHASPETTRSRLTLASAAATTPSETLPETEEEISQEDAETFETSATSTTKTDDDDESSTPSWGTDEEEDDDEEDEASEDDDDDDESDDEQDEETVATTVHIEDESSAGQKPISTPASLNDDSDDEDEDTGFTSTETTSTIPINSTSTKIESKSLTGAGGASSSSSATRQDVSQTTTGRSPSSSSPLPSGSASSALSALESELRALASPGSSGQPALDAEGAAVVAAILPVLDDIEHKLDGIAEKVGEKRNGTKGAGHGQPQPLVQEVALEADVVAEDKVADLPLAPEEAEVLREFYNLTESEKLELVGRLPSEAIVQGPGVVAALNSSMLHRPDFWALMRSQFAEVRSSARSRFRPIFMGVGLGAVGLSVVWFAYVFCFHTVFTGSQAAPHGGDTQGLFSMR